MDIFFKRIKSLQKRIIRVVNGKNKFAHTKFKKALFHQYITKCKISVQDLKLK